MKRIISETLLTDCIEYTKTLPDNFFDLMIADPPYYSGPERRGHYGNKKSPIGVHHEYAITEEWEVPTEEQLKELMRVSRYYIIFGCNYFLGTEFAAGRIVWDKCNGNTSFSDCEIAATNLFDSVRLFRFMWNGMLQGKSISEGHVMQGNKKLNERRIHPTQKPIMLYEWIFQKYTKEGWSIFDPYLGSGSSRIAAYKAGLDFTGCEKQKHYFDAQNKRFMEYTSQISLF